MLCATRDGGQHRIAVLSDTDSPDGVSIEG
jgi:hypothetical protein